MSRHHKFPRCQITGKVRLGERKDVHLVLAAGARARSQATLHGLDSSRREVRGYRCDDCHGWHLTSSPARNLPIGRSADHGRRRNPVSSISGEGR